MAVRGRDARYDQGGFAGPGKRGPAHASGQEQADKVESGPDAAEMLHAVHGLDNVVVLDMVEREDVVELLDYGEGIVRWRRQFQDTHAAMVTVGATLRQHVETG